MQGCFGSAEGRAGEPHACANSPDEKRARNNQKKVKTSKFTVVKKVVKNEKTGKQQKNSKKKKRKRDKKAEQEEQDEAKVPTSQGAAKKQAETTKT